MDNNNYYNNNNTENKDNTQNCQPETGREQGTYNQNPYGYRQSTGTNPYQNSPYRQPQYNQPQYHQPNYGAATNKAPKGRKQGMGAFIGKCAAGAAVFGLVASLVFTGASYVGTRALGISSSGSSTEKTKIVTNSSVSQTSTGNAADLADVSAIAEEVMPSIVAITNVGTVTYQSFFGTQSYDAESAGSGIIIKENDKYLYIVTNNHVVANADTLTVQFSDGKTASAEVTGTDASDDLAVVQVKLDSIEKDTLEKIKVATVGDSTAMTVGQSTIAIGNALGYGQSVTTGIVSALGRTVSTQDETTGQTITNANLIQTDAAINPGNSGGALLNGSGEVIGINSVKYADTGVEGIGYAIPMADAVPIIEALINGDKLPQTAYLGISGQDVSSDVASVYNMPQGVYVAEVMQGSAAEKSGIKQGDIITAIDDTEVGSMSELKSIIVGYKEGKEVTVKFSRMSDGGYTEKEAKVTLGGSSETSSSGQSDNSGNGKKGNGNGQENDGFGNGEEGGLEDFYDYFSNGR